MAYIPLLQIRYIQRRPDGMSLIGDLKQRFFSTGVYARGKVRLRLDWLIGKANGRDWRVSSRSARLRLPSDRVDGVLGEWNRLWVCSVKSKIRRWGGRGGERGMRRRPRGGICVIARTGRFFRAKSVCGRSLSIAPSAVSSARTDAMGRLRWVSISIRCVERMEG